MGLVVFGADAYAQQIKTVGDVLDRGGRKLGKEEVRQLITGATVSGTQGSNFPNTTFQNTFSASGSVNGDAWNKGTWFTKMSGKWWVNDAGQFCQDLVNSQNGKVAGCQTYYVVGNTYYLAVGDARSNEVNERRIAR